MRIVWCFYIDLRMLDVMRGAVINTCPTRCISCVRNPVESIYVNYILVAAFCVLGMQSGGCIMPGLIQSGGWVLARIDCYVVGLVRG